jgi:hypothetical protein
LLHAEKDRVTRLPLHPQREGGVAMIEAIRALQNGGFRSPTDITQRLSAVIPAVVAARAPLRRLASAWAPPARRAVPGAAAGVLAPAVLLVLAGASCMYMFDPDRGAERRATAAQWLTSLWEQGREMADRGAQRLRALSRTEGTTGEYAEAARPTNVTPIG